MDVILRRHRVLDVDVDQVLAADAVPADGLHLQVVVVGRATSTEAWASCWLPSASGIRPDRGADHLHLVGQAAEGDRAAADRDLVARVEPAQA